MPAMTKDGKNWLTAALDPFHDTQLDVRGFPDVFDGSTFVRCLKITDTITKPTGLTPGLAWDAHIFSLPLQTYENYTQVQFNVAQGGGSYASRLASDPLITLGPVNVACADTGVPTLPTYANGVVADQNKWGFLNSEGITRCNDAALGQSRVIAMGFEVRNTTSIQTRGGSQISYVQPAHPGVGPNLCVDVTARGGATVAAGGRLYQGSSRTIALPPSSASLAMQLPAAKRSSAINGGYVPCRLSSEHNPMCAKTQEPIFVMQEGILDNNSQIVGFGSNLQTTGWGTAPTYATNTCVIAATNTSKLIPFNSSGLYIIGLDESSTFELDITIYVECAATADSANASISNIKPSPVYDPVALATYFRALRKLPAGTDVSNNDAGDWWDDALAAISETAGFAGDVVGMVVPGASAVGAGVGAAAKAAQQLGRAVQAANRQAKAMKERQKAPPPKQGAKPRK